MKGQSKSISTALAKQISTSISKQEEDAIEFIRRIIAPQLPDDDILDPDTYTDFLRAQSAVQYRINVNLYFSIYQLCYNAIIVNDELAPKDNMFEVGDKIYRWQILRDYDGNRFAGVSEFINWLAGEIGSSRATVWRKVSLIRNLLGIGLSLEDAYSVFSLGSFSVNKVMKTIGEFKEGKLVDISPVVAEKFIRDSRIANNKDGELLAELWEQSQDSMKSYSHFISKITPYIRNMVEDFKHFEEASELRQWEDSVLVDPEYSFRVRNDSLIVRVTFYKYNPDEDNKYVSKIEEEILIPTSRADGVLTDEIIQALDKFLPIRRRTQS